MKSPDLVDDMLFTGLVHQATEKAFFSSIKKCLLMMYSDVSSLGIAEQQASDKHLDKGNEGVSIVMKREGPTPSSTGPMGLGIITSSNSRTYDYTQKYSPDKPGEKIGENARVWNVYLDEAENYDADLIQGYRSTIDGLLVFAALFSAVVTTFVAQTSQILQPDNAQILVSLLVETNQLLRAAGNGTKSNAVPTADLGPGSLSYTSIDLWVNGLFFTSLALSLSTALLTVLAKQWIQAYTTTVSGGAKTRALIRHFRFQGLVKWKLDDIIESLPLILHSSVAIFLVGLVLYVSQFSTSIAGAVASVTALTFLFYLGTSMIPAICLNCPYRLSCLFPLAQLIYSVFCAVKYVFCFLWRCSGCAEKPQMKWPTASQGSLKAAEYEGVFPNSSQNEHYTAYWASRQLVCDTLNWVSSQSSNHSVHGIVSEAVSELLSKWRFLLQGKISVLEHNLFSFAVLFTLDKFVDMASPSTTEDDFKESVWFTLIQTIFDIHSSTSRWWDHPLTLLNSPLTSDEKCRQQIWVKMESAILAAIDAEDHVLLKYLLQWSRPEVLEPSFLKGTLLHRLASHKGNKEHIAYVLEHGFDPNRKDDDGKTALHLAAATNDLDAVITLVKREPSLIPVRTSPPDSRTALDFGLRWGHSDIVAYLLDKGPDQPPNALRAAAHTMPWSLNLNLVKILLDRGWDRTLKDAEGRAPVDIAKAKGRHNIVHYLEHYQTVRVEPNPGILKHLDYLLDTDFPDV